MKHPITAVLLLGLSLGYTFGNPAAGAEANGALGCITFVAGCISAWAEPD